MNASILNCVVRIEATQSLVCFPGHRYRHLGEKGRRVLRPQTSVQTSGRSECRAPGTGVASALAPADRVLELGVSPSPLCPHPRLVWGPRPSWSLGSPCPSPATSLLPLPHPQSHEGVTGTLLTSVSLCFAVIRAKVVSEKEVDSGNDIYGNPIKRIQYEIKQIKVGVTVAGLLHWAESWEGWERDHTEASHPLQVPLGPWTKSSHPWSGQSGHQATS